MFCRSLFVHLFFFHLTIVLSFFDLRILITSLWYLQILLITVGYYVTLRWKPAFTCGIQINHDYVLYKCRLYMFSPIILPGHLNSSLFLGCSVFFSLSNFHFLLDIVLSVSLIFWFLIIHLSIFKVFFIQYPFSFGYCIVLSSIYG
jgi:hypothetical protein